MLRSQVSERLRAKGQPADAEDVDATIVAVREDISGLLEHIALQLVGCTNDECICDIAALVYHRHATAIAEQAA